MSRTIVYSTSKEGDRGPDGVASKIAKYVPAEMVTLATFFFSAFTISRAWVWVVLLVGAALNALYLFATSRRATDTHAPRWWFYALSGLAFIPWALATIDVVAKTVGLQGAASDANGRRAFVLFAATFVIPLIDELFSAISPSPRKTTATRPR